MYVGIAAKYREVHRRIMYCSIQEAFETSSPVPPATTKKGRSSTKQRRPERPARTGEIERFTPDPDRPANTPMTPSDYVGGGIQQASYSNILTAIDEDQSYFPHPSEDAQGSENAYMLEPDWTKQFSGPALPPWIKERVAAKEAEIPLKPTPTWMDGQATLWQKIPGAYTAPAPAAALPTYPDLDERFHQFESKIDSKLDAMFAKLGELDKGRSESSHIEIILFIIGGLFVLLMLDLLVKQGTRASIMLAAAGGGGLDLYKRYMSR